MTWTIPNILTVIRLLAAPGVILAALFLSRPTADWVVLGLFIGASVTDWVDGYLARAWNQTSRFGAMLDPIADKAMVMIALLIVVATSGVSALVLIPTGIIVFREVFVSGLREFIGHAAGTLKVTPLAKWKTAVQMVAIAVLLTTGLFEHYFGMQSFGMNSEIVYGILAGDIPDELGLVWKHKGMIWSWNIGVALLWLAALITFVTGLDYFRKSLSLLTDPS